MASTRKPAGLDRLPVELLTLVLQEMHQSMLFTMCLVSKKARQVAERLLYRRVAIRRVSASRTFHQSTTRVPPRAELTQQLNYAYKKEESRRGCPDDEEILLHLPNLKKLSFQSPYRLSSAWISLLPSSIDPFSTTRTLHHLTSCHLSFWDDNGEFWSPDQSLCVLYLPSLRRLSICNLKCSSLPAPSCQTSASLPPLDKLIFSECDLHENGLDEFLAARQTISLSLTNFKDGYPPIEEGLSDLADYVPALKRCAKTLQELHVYRYFEKTDGPLPLRALTALRILSTDADTLFLGGYVPGYDQLEKTLPPNIEVLVLETWQDEATLYDLDYIIREILDVEQNPVPRLRRIELTGGSMWGLENRGVELREIAERKHVTLVFTEGHLGRGTDLCA
ncbi:MAG: hypothetical protein MMC23_010019 [Stictis urceolatum]|nr:hypothetical protein [Stictis urceolata]